MIALEQRLARIDLQANAEEANTSHAEALLVAFAARRATERGAPLGYLEDQLKLRFGDALPVTVSRAAPLTFRRWRPGEPTVPGEMNIPEPPPEVPEVEPDLLFVPLSAFDRRGHRIGFGAGHYDRTLARLRAKGRVTAVGIAYSVSEVPRAPDEPHDQRLDYILTESELIDTRNRA